MTPYEAVYGRTPSDILSYTLGTASNALVDSELSRDQILKELQQNLQQAQKRMKQRADKHRSEKTFKPGDWVYLKIQPFLDTRKL